MMEERRLERQKRLLAMRHAASSLPSSQEKEFNLRLVDLYREHPCLWKISLPAYKDTDIKRSSWEKIASQLGSHLTAEFGKPPEKLYYIDRFAFLEAQDEPDDQKSSSNANKQNISKSEGFAKLWSDFNLKSMTKRDQKRPKESTDASSRESHRYGQSIADMVKMRMDAQAGPLAIERPRLKIPDLKKNIVWKRNLGHRPSAISMGALSETLPTLQARPGDSVSKTKMNQKDRDSEQPTTSRMAQSALANDGQSEDEELYKMHWKVRTAQRSLRPGHDRCQKLPTQSRPSKPSEPTPDIF
ncbi:GD15621 [Drosophila simulans]|uniref:GD15621 n=1 Tax=Drosophila simulans TaxID=7240 RepID=B4R717_DROSI|nr:GD15621 [Drosophila simulans]